MSTTKGTDATYLTVELGFPAKAGVGASATVGDAEFDIATKGAQGWSRPEDDRKIVAAMRRAGEIAIKAVSARGNTSTDTYSLMGVSAALDRAEEACGGGNGES